MPVKAFIAWARAWKFNGTGQPECFPKTDKLSQFWLPNEPNAQGGDAYRGGDFETCIVAELPAPPAPPPSKPKQSPRPSGGNDRAGTAFSKSDTSWQDILGGDAVCVREVDGKAYWRRPGKSERSISATTGHCRTEDGRDLLYMFSSNWAPFQPNTAYDKFAAYALLHHRGDFSAAARQLRLEGWGTARTNGKHAGMNGHGRERGFSSGQNGHPKERPGDANDSKSDDDRGDAWEGEEQPPPDLPNDPYDDGRHDDQGGDAGPDGRPAGDVVPKIETYTIADLVAKFPTMREPVIDGLLRDGETMNIIATPKTGKSWLVTNLAFSVATGKPWLGFTTKAGNVLVIDNELHKETLASRLRRVAEANRIDLATVADQIVVMPLRGRLTNLFGLGTYFREQIPGRFQLTIIDAYYRTLPIGTDENDNAAVAELYNVLDNYADQVQCSFALIHHASKGNQSQKSVTDVGSGAGSQSRAADTHLILREHAESNVVVLDAAVRSFPPISPRCLRWEWPSFTVAEDLDPTELRQPSSRRRRSQAETEPPAAPVEPTWDAKRFADTFATAEPKTRASILAAAADAGLKDRKAEELLKGAIEREYLFLWSAAGARTQVMISNTRPPQKKQGKMKHAKKNNP
jgi:hypothetical protein